MRSVSGRPAVALRTWALWIDLDCVKKARPGGLVEDDGVCERRVALRHCAKERLFRLSVMRSDPGIYVAGPEPVSGFAG